MKTAKLVLLAFLSLSSVFADIPNPNGLPELALDREEINMGTLAQPEGASAYHQILIKRDAKTPEKVVLSFNFKFLNKVCTRWERRWVWNPNRCQPYPGYPHPACPYPGDWEEERFCVEYQDVVTPLTREMVLDFDKAYSLNGDELETFELTFLQKDYRTDEIKLTGRAVNTRGAYEIKKRGAFSREGLKFKALD